MQRHVDESRDDVGRVESAIEPILELREVSLRLLGTNRMVGAVHGVLDVAENRIDPSKLGALDRGFAAAHHDLVMRASSAGAKHRE